MKDGILGLRAALADRYEIEREIGAGGMATVFLASDVRHHRKVAVKVLNPELGAVLGAERFLSEIRVTASLQHPNLLPLFDSGEADGLLFYVMPYVEGETLRQYIDREKQLSVEESVRIAAAIASALDYAHRRGVVHRDLKPENILLHEGQPLVADFGIALAISNAGGTRITQTGISLGTPSYMSPEQATGDRAVDGRTDVYSLGAVLYEMLAGEPPHRGATAQAVIARLIAERPRSVQAARPSVPDHVAFAVERALEKIPSDRWATAGQFSDALTGKSAVQPPPRARKASPALPWSIAAAASLMAVAAGFAWWRASRAEIARQVRMVVDIPNAARVVDAQNGNSVAISPDGSTIAYLAGNEDQLHLRRLDQLATVARPEALRPYDAHFSPDGQWVAFWSGGVVKRIAVTPEDPGAAPQIVATIGGFNGLTWGRTGVVWMRVREMYRESPQGKAQRIAVVDTSVDAAWSAPFAMPDGKTIAFRLTPRGAAPGTTADRIGMISIDGGARTLVDLEAQNVIGFANGILVYGRVDGRIAAVRFDLAARKPAGDPVTVVDNVKTKAAGGVSAAMSDDGTLVYIGGSSESMVQLIDIRGALIESLVRGKLLSRPTWSPDGRRIAILVGSPLLDAEVWLYDTGTRVFTRTNASAASSVAWTPDGRRIAYVKVAGGRGVQVMWMPADGSGTPEEVPGTASLNPLSPQSIRFSPDGKYVLLRVLGLGNPTFAVPLAGGPPIKAIVPEGQNGPPRYNPAVSPNERWIAFSSPGTDNPHQVFVRAFPSGIGRVQISTTGGTEPWWSPDGTRLLYRGAGAFRSALLDTSGSMPRVIRTDSLFADRFQTAPGAMNYSIHPDGKRVVAVEEAGAGWRVIVVTNWLAEVRERLRSR